MFGVDELNKVCEPVDVEALANALLNKTIPVLNALLKSALGGCARRHGGRFVRKRFVRVRIDCSGSLRPKLELCDSRQLLVVVLNQCMLHSFQADGTPEPQGAWVRTVNLAEAMVEVGGFGEFKRSDELTSIQIGACCCVGRTGNGHWAGTGQAGQLSFSW